jgi:hypothetical protein
VAADEAEDLGVSRDDGLRQISQQAEHHARVAQPAERDLAQNERVPEHLASLEQAGEGGIPAAQMIDPDGGIDEQQLRSRLFGAAARRRRKVRLAAAEPGEAAGALTLDQRLQRLAHQGGFLRQPRAGLGLGEEGIIEGEGGAHQARDIASGDAGFNAETWAGLRQGKGGTVAGTAPKTSGLQAALRRSRVKPPCGGS